MRGITVTLPVGSQLSVIADDVSSGRVFRFVEQVGDTPGCTDVAAGETKTFGPFAVPARYAIESLVGALAYSAAPVDFPTSAEATAAALAVLTTAGDMLILDADGNPARLAKGADGDVMTMVDGLPAWVTPA